MTTAKEKIETLTNSWYGYAVAAGIFSLLKGGLGVFSIFTAVASTVFVLVLTWFLGRRLLAKSSFTRTILIVVSAVSTCLGTYGAAKMGWAFLHEWSLGLLFNAGFTATGVVMNARSFRVLTSKMVRGYFA